MCLSTDDNQQYRYDTLAVMHWSIVIDNLGPLKDNESISETLKTIGGQ